MTKTIKVTNINVSVVGLGLMGCSITTCLLMAGHTVVAVAPIESDLIHAKKRIFHHLSMSRQEGLVKHSPEYYLKRLNITEDYSMLKECKLVIECTLENIDIKKAVYQKIERVIHKDAILTSNTSAIPISILQKETKNPHRFLDCIGLNLLTRHVFWKSFVVSKVIFQKENIYMNFPIIGVKSQRWFAKI